MACNHNWIHTEQEISMGPAQRCLECGLYRISEDRPPDTHRWRILTRDEAEHHRKALDDWCNGKA